ncbi:unnamed protein product [Effrenium voratum]|uniref:Uncharacterized protein n=1 Tax=Effrenium voratum TaxID=2562239 RepID=A0AA36JCB2_9DINO|nr:unnamed protein product [Effrenium voratum]
MLRGFPARRAPNAKRQNATQVLGGAAFVLVALLSPARGLRSFCHLNRSAHVFHAPAQIAPVMQPAEEATEVVQARHSESGRRTSAQAEAQKRKEEAERRKQEAIAKRQEEEQRRKEENEQKRAEAQKQREEAEARRKEAAEQAKAEAAKKKEEAEKARAEAEAKRKEEDEKRKAEAEAKRKEAEEKRKEADEVRKQAEAKKKEEAEKARAEADAKKKAEEETRKAEAEQKKAEAEKARAEADAKKKAEEEKRKAEAEQKKAEADKARAEADAKKKAEEEQRKAEEEKRKAEAEQKKAEADKARAEADAKKKAEEEQRKAEAEKKKAEAEKARAEADAKKKAEEEQRKAEAEQKKAEADKARAEADAKKKAEEEQRKAEAEKKKAEAEKARAEADAKKKAEEEQRKAEAEKKKAEAEKARAEADAKKKAEEEQRKAEAEQKKAEAEKARAEARAEAEAKKKAEDEKRLAVEAEKKAAAEKARAEVEAKKKADEEARKAAEAEKKAAAEKARAEAEAKKKADEEARTAAEAEKKAAAEKARAEAEAKKKADEDARKAAEAEKKAAAEKARAEAEAKKKADEEARKAAADKARADAEAKKTADEEARKAAEAEKKAAAEKARADAEAKKKADEEARKAAADKARADAEAKKTADEEARKAAEAEKKAAAEKARADAEAKKKADEDARKAAEAEKKAAAEKARADAEAKKKADEEARKAAADKARADAEAKKTADEEARKAAEAEKKAAAEKARADAEAKKKADEDARKAAEAEKKEAAEKARAEAEAKKKADDEARKAAEAEKKAAAEKAAEQARVEAEAKKKADDEARQVAAEKAKAEAETKKKADEEARKAAAEKAKAQAEAKKKADEAARKAAEAKKKADAEKAKADAEAKKKAAEDAKKEAEAVKRAEAARAAALAEAQQRAEKAKPRSYSAPVLGRGSKPQGVAVAESSASKLQTKEKKAKALQAIEKLSKEAEAKDKDAINKIGQLDRNIKSTQESYNKAKGKEKEAKLKELNKLREEKKKVEKARKQAEAGQPLEKRDAPSPNTCNRQQNTREAELQEDKRKLNTAKKVGTGDSEHTAAVYEIRKAYADSVADFQKAAKNFMVLKAALAARGQRAHHDQMEPRLGADMKEKAEPRLRQINLCAGVRWASALALASLAIMCWRGLAALVATSHAYRVDFTSDRKRLEPEADAEHLGGAQRCQYSALPSQVPSGRPPFRSLMALCPSNSLKDSCQSEARSSAEVVKVVPSSKLGIAECESYCNSNFGMESYRGVCKGYVIRSPFNDGVERGKAQCWLILGTAEPSHGFPDEVKIDRSSLVGKSNKLTFFKEFCGCESRVIHFRRQAFRTDLALKRHQLAMLRRDTPDSADIAALSDEVKTHELEEKKYARLTQLEGVYDWLPLRPPHRMAKGSEKLLPARLLELIKPGLIQNQKRSYGNYWEAPVRISKIFKKSDLSAFLYLCLDKSSSQENWYLATQEDPVSWATSEFRHLKNHSDDDVKAELGEANFIQKAFFRLECMGTKIGPRNEVVYEAEGQRISELVDDTFISGSEPSTDRSRSMALQPAGCYTNTKKAQDAVEEKVVGEVGQCPVQALTKPSNNSAIGLRTFWDGDAGAMQKLGAAQWLVAPALRSEASRSEDATFTVMWKILEPMKTSIFDEFDLREEAKFTLQGKVMLQEFTDNINAGHYEPTLHRNSIKLTTPNAVATSSKYILIQSLAAGTPLKNYLEDSNGQVERIVDWKSNIYSAILMVYGHMVVKHGFFQSDPHNGNWFWEPKSKTVTLIDWGGVGQLDESTHCKLANLYDHMGELVKAWNDCEAVTLAGVPEIAGTYTRSGYSIYQAGENETALLFGRTYGVSYFNEALGYRLFYDEGKWELVLEYPGRQDLTTVVAELETPVTKMEQLGKMSPQKWKFFKISSGKHKFDKRVTVRVRDPDSCELPSRKEAKRAGGVSAVPL